MTNILMINSEREWRGGENQVVLLAAGLRPPYAAILACQPGSPLASRARAAGIDTYEIAMRGELHVGAIRRLRAVLRERDVALVHAHTSHAHALALFANWGSERPLVVTRRVVFPVGRGPIARWKYGRRVRRFIAVSQEVGRVLVDGGVDEERVSVITSGIDFARFTTHEPEAIRKIRADLGCGDHHQLFGIVAALTEEKDHRTLLDAWAQVERAAPNARLALIGSGPLESALRGQAERLRLKNAHFTGFRDDIPAILAALDGFVLSSRHEGLGTSVMDAMSLGVPTVATAVGGVPELITDGKDGLLVPAGDPPALAAAISRIAGDAALRQRLGEAARATAALRFSHERMVEDYTKLYGELLG